MKILTVLSVLVLCVIFSEQKSQYVNCPENNIYLSDPNIHDGCFKVVCQSRIYGGDYILPCTKMCIIGNPATHYNISKTYPDCCDDFSDC